MWRCPLPGLVTESPVPATSKGEVLPQPVEQAGMEADLAQVEISVLL